MCIFKKISKIPIEFCAKFIVKHLFEDFIYVIVESKNMQIVFDLLVQFPLRFMSH